MSTISRTIQCDWPGCNATLTVTSRECLRDYIWSQCGMTDDHLCPDHRHHDFGELAAEIERAEAKEETEQP